MPTATHRASARRALLDAMAERGLQAEHLDRASAAGAEAQRLRTYGAEVEEWRRRLAELQEGAAGATVADSALVRLGRAVLDAGLTLPPIDERRRSAEALTSLERDLAELSGDRSLLGRARTKGRRLRLQAQIDGLRRDEAGADLALGRRLAVDGWLDAVRTEATADAVEAVAAALGDGNDLSAARQQAQVALELASLPTALDLRPLLSRTRASEGASTEAAEGAETEAIEALLADPAPALQPLVDALKSARAAEHESQRVALEAQLAAIE